MFSWLFTLNNLKFAWGGWELGWKCWTSFKCWRNEELLTCLKFTLEGHGWRKYFEVILEFVDSCLVYIRQADIIILFLQWVLSWVMDIFFTKLILETGEWVARLGPPNLLFLAFLFVFRIIFIWSTVGRKLLKHKHKPGHWVGKLCKHFVVVVICVEFCKFCMVITVLESLVWYVM